MNYRWPRSTYRLTIDQYIGWLSVGNQPIISRQSTDSRLIVDCPSPMVMLFVWAWQVLHSEYSDLYVKASNSLSKPFKKGTNCILIVGWNNWEEDWQEMCAPSKVCKVISRPAFWIKITWPFKKKIMLSLWFLKFIFCFWYCGIFLFGFFKHHISYFQINRNFWWFSLGDNSREWRITSRGNRYQIFLQNFLQNLYSIWFPMHSHISADYGNNNKYYYWKVNLSLYFCFNTRFCQMSM